MKKNLLLAILILAATLATSGRGLAQEGQDPGAVFRIEVDMILLNVAVTDDKGNYVTGLHPWDFQITEDGVSQKIATFAEGNEAPRQLADFKQEESKPQLVKPQPAKITEGLAQPPSFLDAESPEHINSLSAGASVFILFDTSNYMYRGFVHAQDAVAQFIRTLDSPDRVALYSYSRDFLRAAPLTGDRAAVLRGLRGTVAGDNAALYNALLLTLRDAAQLSGRKVVVAFSNGPDDASMVAPEDVREFAQSEGIPIYMVSTHDAQLDPVSTAVFGRISASTGGKVYFAKSWEDQQKAFASIRDDLAHLYALSYYPQVSPNRGWRGISVKLVGQHLQKFKIRTRTGYLPRAARVSPAAEQNP